MPPCSSLRSVSTDTTALWDISAAVRFPRCRWTARPRACPRRPCSALNAGRGMQITIRGYLSSYAIVLRPTRAFLPPRRQPDGNRAGTLWSLMSGVITGRPSRELVLPRRRFASACHGNRIGTIAVGGLQAAQLAGCVSLFCRDGRRSPVSVGRSRPVSATRNAAWRTPPTPARWTGSPATALSSAGSGPALVSTAAKPLFALSWTMRLSRAAPRVPVPSTSTGCSPSGGYSGAAPGFRSAAASPLRADLPPIGVNLLQ